MKKVKFNIATAEGTRQKEGYLFTHENGMQLVVHTIFDGAGWNVSDFKTGIQIGSYATSRKDAILYVNAKINSMLDIQEKLNKYEVIN